MQSTQDVPCLTTMIYTAIYIYTRCVVELQMAVLSSGCYAVIFYFINTKSIQYHHNCIVRDCDFLR